MVLVPSLINRAAILDLRPGQSLVEHLLGAGLDVYSVDWGEPSAADAHLDLKAYALRLLPSALQAARRESAAASVHVFGYCLGGTLALIQGQPSPPFHTVAGRAATSRTRTRTFGLASRLKRPG